MRKDLKRQIKQDEFRTGLERVLEWARAHRDEVRIALIVLAVVGAGAAGLTYLQRRQAAGAERALAAAIEMFYAPVEGEVPEGVETPPGAGFPTATEKFTKAVAAFDGVERRYASKPAAVRARYYGALCRMEIGRLAEAQQALTEIAARKDPRALEPTLARLALAEIHRRSGRTDQAIEAYRQLVEDRSLPIPRDHALMSLASTLEEARRMAEARASYRRLFEEFPTSVYAPEARRRAAYLETAGQG